MNSSLNDLVPCFYGRDVTDEIGQQDPTEFIETLHFAIDGQTYTDEARKQTATRIIFRSRLRDKALLWYRDLTAEVRGNWQSLEAAFLVRFALVPRKEADQTWFLNLVLNLKQRGRSIVDYTREGDQLNAKCPEKFRDLLGHQFIAGLDDKGKVDLVQVYSGADKSTVTYTEAKRAVSKAYTRFGEPSPLDELHDPPFSPPPPTPVQSELVALLQALRIPPPAPLRDNSPYRANYGNANGRDQNSRPSFYQGIYCYNCREEGHYSTSCTRPVVSGAQRNANRWAIDELQGGPSPIPSRTRHGIRSSSSPICPGSSGKWWSGKTKARWSKDEQYWGGQCGYFEAASSEKGNFEHHHKYSIGALTQSHKLAPTKFSEPKVLQPTLQITTPVTRIAERPLTQQTSRNLEGLNDKIARLPFLSTPPLEDEEKEDNVTGRGDSHVM